MTQPQQEQGLEDEFIIIEDASGLVDEDSNEFGLTKRDYLFLLYDIELAIVDFDREHGYVGTRYHDEFGNYVYSLDKVKTLDQQRKRQCKTSAQDVAIAKGLIKITKWVDPK